jgi:hypothetical protein
MPRIAIKASDIAKIVEPRLPRALVERAGVRAAYRGQALLRKRTPVDQGQLKNSWQVHPRPGAREFVTIENRAPHAGIVERGARPHPVSRAGKMALYWWVVRNRKKFSSLRTAGGRASRIRHRIASGPVQAGGTRPMAQLDPRVMSIVWGIVKKLEKKGQKPTYFVKNSLPTLEKFFAIEAQRAVREIGARKP